jgi:hypothetical protein
MVFGTINCVPLIFLVFKRDEQFGEDMTKVMLKLSESAMALSDPKIKKELKKKDVLTVNHSLHLLLGSCYSINPKVPILKLGSVLQETNTIDDSASRQLKNGTDGYGLNSTESLKNTKSSATDLYYWSVVVLFVYLMLSVKFTPYPSVAFLNCLALLFVDYLHASSDLGSSQWSPGKIFSH